MSERRHYLLFKIGVAVVSLAVIICYGALIANNLDIATCRKLLDHENASIAEDLFVRYKERSSSSDSGYILATHYSDQLTGSAVNLFSLQYWASTLKVNVRVVKPYGSLLGVSLDPPVNNTILFTEGNNNEVRMMTGENTVKLGDVFDTKGWSNFTKIHFVSSLVSWKHFLKHSPRNLILVNKVCNDNRLKCMQCNDSFSESIIFHDNAVNFAKFNGFEIVCYDLKVYNISSFKELVYGEFNPDNTVVIFNHWGGIALGSYK